jgi:hypothetical protein
MRRENKKESVMGGRKYFFLPIYFFSGCSCSNLVVLGMQTFILRVFFLDD